MLRSNSAASFADRTATASRDGRQVVVVLSHQRVVDVGAAGFVMVPGLRRVREAVETVATSLIDLTLRSADHRVWRQFGNTDPQPSATWWGSEMSSTTPRSRAAARSRANTRSGP